MIDKVSAKFWPAASRGRTDEKPVCWHEAEVLTGWLYGRSRSVSGHGKIGTIDPNVWSGRALQEVFIDLAVSGLASMYPALDWSALCSGHHGYQRACGLISG